MADPERLLREVTEELSRWTDPACEYTPDMARALADKQAEALGIRLIEEVEAFLHG